MGDDDGGVPWQPALPRIESEGRLREMVAQRKAGMTKAQLAAHRNSMRRRGTPSTHQSSSE